MNVCMYVSMNVVDCLEPLYFSVGSRSMLFLTVHAIIGNQAFQNERCHICFSLGLDKEETRLDYQLLFGKGTRAPPQEARLDSWTWHC